MERRPYENVFLQSAIEAPRTAEDLFIWRDHNQAVSGVVYFGAHAVLAADDDTAVDAFAVEARRHPGMRSFVGPADRLAHFWTRVQVWHPQPSIVRGRQPLYALVPAALNAPERVAIRRAVPDEAEAIAGNSAEMMIGELGYDPRERSGFTSNVRRAIEAGLWWVWNSEGELRFQCNIGARTSRTAQIQGVWTPPALRGHGYARAALGSISAALLDECATLSLYVNDFNRPAIALYEQLGYVQVATFATYLFTT